MAGPGTTFEGPVLTGTKKDADANGPANLGLSVLMQTLTLNVNGTSAVTASVVLPYGSQIIDFHADTLTAWNSGTSDTLSIGTAAAGTQYVGSVSVAAAGRGAITYSAAQLTAMSNIAANTTVYATVTPVGTAATTGQTLVTIIYAQTVQLTVGSA